MNLKIDWSQDFTIYFDHNGDFIWLACLEKWLETIVNFLVSQQQQWTIEKDKTGNLHMDYFKLYIIFEKNDDTTLNIMSFHMYFCF